MIERIFNVPGLNVYITLAGIIISASIHLVFAKKTSRQKKIEIVLMHSIGISAFMSIVGFIGHAFFSETLANSIGWPAGNPFQIEVAGANLGIGLIGYLGYWRRDFWLPYILVRTCFMYTAGTIHVVEIIKSKNFSPGNAGPILYWDFLWPVILITLYIIHIRIESGEAQKGYLRIRPLASEKSLSGK
jgi:hypothetical protein